MPLPRMQTMLLTLSMLSLLLLLCYLSFTTFASSSPGQATSSFLFPASAVISLTDDNSTFFISRPAAFGPSLPKVGMEGELFVLEEGQLACDDTPGWDPSAMTGLTAPASLPLAEGSEDDGTDNNLNPPLSSTSTTKTSYHADIESLQQSAEIEGKIVLVSRGGCGFLEKVLWTQRRGGVALIVGDYKRSGIHGGSGLVTMYAKGDTSNVSIPSLFTSHTTAALLTTLLSKFPNQSLSESAARPKHSVGTPAPSLVFRDVTVAPQVASDSDDSNNGDRILGEQTLDRIPGEQPRQTPIPTPTPTTTLVPVPTKTAFKTPPAAERTGLWITLTPTTMTSSPFFDTLLVLVVSPLVTLTVVYALLLLRSRIRRRRWRAPKSLVERLPVRVYHSTSSTPRTPPFSPRHPQLPSVPPRTSSLPTVPSMEGAASTGTVNAPTSPPQRRNTTSPAAFFHRRWSGNNECVVCLEEYVDGVSKVMKLPCGHEFHVGCITPWLTTRRRTCPICKGDVVRAVRGLTEPLETAADGADETTPLVLGVDEDDVERVDRE